MTEAQPNAMQSLAGTISEETTQDTVTGDHGAAAEQEGERQPKYVGDMPVDPEEARTYRPDDDQPHDRDER